MKIHLRPFESGYFIVLALFIEKSLPLNYFGTIVEDHLNVT